MKALVIIPAYNEGIKLEMTADRLRRYLDRAKNKRSIDGLIVDDGSTEPKPRELAHRFKFISQHTHSLEQRIVSLNPELVLKRGYAMISKKGKVIGSSKNLKQDDSVAVRFHDGEMSAKIL